MAPRDTGRYTSGQIEVDLQRIIRRMLDADRADWERRLINFGEEYAARFGPTVDQDRELATLHNMQLLVVHLDLMIDKTIVLARRRRRPASWAAIGRAIGTTGQAAGKRARTRDLPVVRLTPQRYAELIEATRKITGYRG